MHLLSFLGRRHWRLLAALLAMIAGARADSSPSPLTVSSPSLALTSGFAYSRGDYGFATDTEVFSVPLNLTYDTGDWVFRAGMPWNRIKGPAGLVLTGTQAGGGPLRPVTGEASGVGDLLLSATHRLNPSPDRLNVEFTGRIKLGLASEAKGLGTGQTDFHAQVDFARPYGDLVPFATVGYRFLGRSNRYPLLDGAFLGTGVLRHLTSHTNVGLALDWRQRIIAGGDHGCELTGFVTHHLDRSWSLQGYALTGFTNASPDIGFGGLVNYRF